MNYNHEGRKDIHYSDGRTVSSVIVIWDDWHEERAAYYRAYWASSPDDTTGSPVIGYGSPGGSHRRIYRCKDEARRLYPGVAIYRMGKEL